MTIFEILRDIQEARARVELWGVNFRTLAIVAGVAFVVFVISLREVLTWFLRINALRRELRELRAELAEQRTRSR